MTVRQIMDVVNECWVRVIVKGNVFYDEREDVLCCDSSQRKNLKMVIDKEVFFICSSYDEYDYFIDITIE